MNLSERQKNNLLNNLATVIEEIKNEMATLKVGGLTLGKATHTFSDTTTWVLTDEEEKNVLLEVDGTTGGATDIEATPSDGKIFIINNNGTGSNIVIKANGETGVTVATGATTIVVGNGTDFIAVAS